MLSGAFLVPHMREKRALSNVLCFLQSFVEIDRKWLGMTQAVAVSVSLCGDLRNNAKVFSSQSPGIQPSLVSRYRTEL